MSKFEAGDRVVLLDFRHHTQQNSPYSYFWVKPMNKLIGTELIVEHSGDLWVSLYGVNWGFPKEWLKIIKDKFEIEYFDDEDFLI